MSQGVLLTGIVFFEKAASGYDLDLGIVFEELLEHVGHELVAAVFDPALSCVRDDEGLAQQDGAPQQVDDDLLQEDHLFGHVGRQFAHLVKYELVVRREEGGREQSVVPVKDDAALVVRRSVLGSNEHLVIR